MGFLERGVVTGASQSPRRIASTAESSAERASAPAFFWLNLFLKGDPKIFQQASFLICGSLNALAAISGPIPAGSPVVTAMVGLYFGIQTFQFHLGFGLAVFGLVEEELAGGIGF